MTARPVPTSVRSIRRRRRPPARGPQRRHWLSAAAATVFAAVWFFPVYWMINTAFKPRSEAMTPTPRFVPTKPTLSNFHAAIAQTSFPTNLRNSIVVTLGAVAVCLLVGVFAAAALSRFRFGARRALMVTILIIQMLPGSALLIPTFLVFNRIGLLGTHLGLVLAYVALVLPFSIWMMRNFFVAIPIEIEEAGYLDGCTVWQVLTRILIPLVAPGLVATSIFAFITAWNDYLTAYTFMQDQSQYTLPVWLASFSTPLTGTDYSGQMAGSVVFSLPVVVFFLLIQRNLVSGLSAGAVKG